MKKQSGFTLIELMIGLTVGLIVIAGASTFFVNTLYANIDGVKQQQLEQTANTLVETMADDVRRAGYTTAGQSAPTLTLAPGKSLYVSADCFVIAYRNSDNSIAYRGYLRANSAIYVLKGNVNPTACALTDTTAWNTTPVTDTASITVTAPTAPPSGASVGAVAGSVFQIDPVVSKLLWIHFSVTAVSLKNANGVAATRDMVAAVSLRN